MHRHWRVYGPPAYVAVALRFGLIRPRREADTLSNPDELAQFLANLPGAAARSQL
jgi:hypothetical protein